jgi:hypothetical protein
MESTASAVWESCGKEAFVGQNTPSMEVVFAEMRTDGGNA